MKLLQKYIKPAVMFLLFFAIAACGGDDPQPDHPTPKTQQEMISESWRVVSVVREGQTIASDSFLIVFRPDSTYEFTAPGVPGFPQVGSWAYHTSATGNVITLDGVTDLRIVGQITPTNFVFDYTYSNHKMGDVTVRFTLGPP